MRFSVLIGVLLAAAVVQGAPRGICGAASDRATAPRIAVLSAFHGELAPLVAAATVEEQVEVDGRPYYLGRVQGVRVVLGMLGIGMVNAAATTASVIRAFAPAAIVVSGVAGSPQRIGDVVVAHAWVDDTDPAPLAANAALLALTAHATATLPPLANCTTIPPTDPLGEVRCLAFTPTVVFGGTGHSGDPFGGGTFPCTPGSHDVFGCDLPAVAAAPVPFAAEDMESTAVARVAAQHRIPFVAMRAVSDGAGDPLGDRGFPVQFFDYYRLAAENAARVTIALLLDVSALRDTARGRRVCRALGRRRWGRAARAAEKLVIRAAGTTRARRPAASP
jgi:adenosylhomocysteine nucleosidase